MSLSGNPTRAGAAQRRRRRAVAAALLVTAALLATSCTGDGEEVGGGGPDRQEIVTAVAENVIVPGYRELVDATADLTTAVDVLCADPTGANLQAARRAWDTAMGAWLHTTAFEFGPVRSLRSGAQIAYPVDADKVTELVDPGSTEPLDPAAVADLGADARGLNALQYLLFAPPSASDLTERHCTYVTAAAALVQAGAEELLEAWVDGVDGEPPALEQFSDPGDDSMWSSTTEALEDLLNSMLSALAAVDRSLGPASGETTAEPEPQEVDAAPAHRALQDMVDQLEGVAAVYGDAGGSPPTGISVLVAEAASEDSDTDARIRGELSSAVDSIGMVPSPLFELDPTEDPEALTSLEAAWEHTMQVRSLLTTEVSSLLGLTVGFSDSDGDA